MQFPAARLVAFSAVICQAVAKVAFTNVGWDVKEGQPFTLEWSGATGPVTLVLKNGPSTDLVTVSTIASGLTGTSYVWTPSGLASDTYAFEIEDAEGDNYSSQFVYSGTGSSTPSAGSTTPAATATPTTPSTAPSTEPSTPSTTTGKPSAASGASTPGSTGRSPTSARPASTSTNSPLTTNASAKMGSPLAFVLVTVVALLFWH